MANLITYYANMCNIYYVIHEVVKAAIFNGREEKTIYMSYITVIKELSGSIAVHVPS